MFTGKQKSGPKEYTVPEGSLNPDEADRTWRDELNDRAKLTDPIKTADEKWKLLPAFFKVRYAHDINILDKRSR
jgi:hypothetical protein